jgi:hypothetical protein
MEMADGRQDLAGSGALIRPSGGGERMDFVTKAGVGSGASYRIRASMPYVPILFINSSPEIMNDITVNPIGQ